MVQEQLEVAVSYHQQVLHGQGGVGWLLDTIDGAICRYGLFGLEHSGGFLFHSNNLAGGFCGNM